MTDKHISAAEIRRAWLDPALTTAQAAAVVGLSRSNLWRRARSLGLPARRVGNRFFVPDSEFASLWLAGVLTGDMAKLYGVYWQTISRTAHRLGLPAREIGGGRHERITLAAYREQKLAERMRELVSAERQRAKLQ